MEGVITHEPIVKKISKKHTDMFSVKCADNTDVKVQCQFLKFLDEPADDQEFKEGSNSASSTHCPADALT